MRLTNRTTLDWLLSYNTNKVTPEELWNASWDGSLAHADTGFAERYQHLADAINAITAMYGRSEYPGDKETEHEPGRGLSEKFQDTVTS